MVLTNEKITQIVNDGKALGFTIRLRDIAFLILSHYFADGIMAYKSVFGLDSNESALATYLDKSEIIYLKGYIDSNVVPPKPKESKKATSEDITLDENKAYMLKLKKETEAAMLSGEIEKKDGLKILTDISVKLNDKFNINDTTDDNLVIVYNKYDDICSKCGAEIAHRPITKEEAMEMYNLVEKQ